jgi:hypothetical protein
MILGTLALAQRAPWAQNFLDPVSNPNSARC